MNNAVVDFWFTEDDYRAREPDLDGSVSLLSVVVLKSIRIASPVIIEVEPVTVAEARSRSLLLPPHLPQNDASSPPYAG